MGRYNTPAFVFATFCTIMRTPLSSGWSYGLLGSLGRRHAQTPCDFGLIRPRNVRCRQGHWSWSWPVWPLLEGYRVENPILQETELGEFLSHIVGGVCVFGLLLPCRTQCVLALKSKPNTHTSRTIWDKNSPNSVSCKIGFSTLHPSSRGQTSQLQDQWPWWQRTFLGRVSPKSHGVCACLRPSDPRSP